MSRQDTIGRPASIIVENVREKTTRSFMPTPLPNDGITNSVGLRLTFVMMRP